VQLPEVFNDSSQYIEAMSTIRVYCGSRNRFRSTHQTPGRMLFRGSMAEASKLISEQQNCIRLVQPNTHMDSDSHCIGFQVH